jgi:hypothetical protein
LFQLLKALQHHNRVETQWALMVERVIFLEDAQRNSCSHDTHFKHSTPRDRAQWVNFVYTPTLGERTTAVLSTHHGQLIFNISRPTYA